jgi:hypothetical protein
MNKPIISYEDLAYITTISCITPPLIGYNIKSLYSCKPPIPWFSASLKMLPGQLTLRTAQLQIATTIKEKTNPWLAFASIGVLQGIVYGHATTSWTRHLSLPANIRPNMFAGILFAASRDSISQGIPFYLSDHGPIAFLATSVASTIASQGLHNCQTIMQLKSHLLYRGFQSRLGMMTVINLLNYYILKPIWKDKDKR